MTLCAGQRHRHRGHIVDTGEGECGARWRSSMDVYTLPFGKDNWREAAGQQRAQLRALGWPGGGEGGLGGRGYVAGLFTLFVHQKLTDHQKTSILQLKELKTKLACKLIRVGSGECSASSCLAAALPRRLVGVPRPWGVVLWLAGAGRAPVRPSPAGSLSPSFL